MCVCVGGGQEGIREEKEGRQGIGKEGRGDGELGRRGDRELGRGVRRN